MLGEENLVRIAVCREGVVRNNCSGLVGVTGGSFNVASSVDADSSTSAGVGGSGDVLTLSIRSSASGFLTWSRVAGGITGWMTGGACAVPLREAKPLTVSGCTRFEGGRIAWNEGRRASCSVFRGGVRSLFLKMSAPNSNFLGEVKPKGSSSATLGFKGVMWNSVARGDVISSSSTLVRPNMSLGNSVFTGDMTSKSREDRSPAFEENSTGDGLVLNVVVRGDDSP